MARSRTQGYCGMVPKLARRGDHAPSFSSSPPFVFPTRQTRLLFQLGRDCSGLEPFGNFDQIVRHVAAQEESAARTAGFFFFFFFFPPLLLLSLPPVYTSPPSPPAPCPIVHAPLKKNTGNRHPCRNYSKVDESTVPAFLPFSLFFSAFLTPPRPLRAVLPGISAA